jgi:cell division septation protein DedD
VIQRIAIDSGQIKSRIANRESRITNLRVTIPAFPFMSDEGFREIQLNGKQLVFMFMAVTASAVVIFLCGVMVGRGVRAPGAANQIQAVATTPADPTAPVDATAPAGAATLPSGAPPSAQETLTYPERLEDATPPPETLEEPAPEATTASTAKAAAEPTAGKAPTGTAATPEPPGNGYAVQVAAVRERSEAETIAHRLAAKGYPSFVTTPGTGAPKVFRVRVGKYADRHEADAVASKLQKEEQFKPWVTR